MSETTYFDHADVKVTDARFISGKETYAVKNITSVKTRTQQPSRTYPIIAILAGIFMLTSIGSKTTSPASVDNFPGEAIFGLMLIVGGAFWAAKLKPLLQVIIKTAGSEETALQTHDPEYLRQVLAALNSAIAHKS